MTRDECIKVLQALWRYKDCEYSEHEVREALEIAINEITRYNSLYKTRAKTVLDKIRAEIEEEYDNCYICEWYEDYDYEENDISEFQKVGTVSDILEIVDKYNTESEV